jgi:hypothetical protein
MSSKDAKALEKDAKALAKDAKAKAKDLAAERRKLRNDCKHLREVLNNANSGILTCRVTALAAIKAFLNIKEFFKKNSSSEDANLKPLLEEIRGFLDEFNQGRFSAEFCIICTLAGRPME